MSIKFNPDDFHEPCKWCQGNGCVYCPPPRDAVKLVAQLQTGQYPIIGIRRYENNTWVCMYKDPEVTDAEAPPPPSPPPACTEHLWQYNLDHKHRRHCSRPGCDARQRYEINASVPDGHWVFYFPVLPDLQELFNRTPPKKSHGKSKIKKERTTNQ